MSFRYPYSHTITLTDTPSIPLKTLSYQIFLTIFFMNI
ncbi:unknown phage protein [Streptococcus pyogenes]|uniref:Phage protein n=1 Tax=Streptococcus pyogenes TaxID=1314 RepID=A0ABD7UUJ3_STRPY|nr:hypothetical protein M28_Spy1034 [Streptococcus pyogenes MGAS6180]AAZ51671.1 hypothetical protein M5005_Spy1053 [Streptococcus pyogenes MGAS5005]AFV38169.1 phage protein [Streptococcus pyogenes A20]VDC39343.1 unknown phage protein [Streptococcus pyogenes]